MKKIILFTLILLGISLTAQAGDQADEIDTDFLDILETATKDEKYLDEDEASQDKNPHLEGIDPEIFALLEAQAAEFNVQINPPTTTINNDQPFVVNPHVVSQAAEPSGQQPQQPQTSAVAVSKGKQLENIQKNVLHAAQQKRKRTQKQKTQSKNKKTTTEQLEDAGLAMMSGSDLQDNDNHNKAAQTPPTAAVQAPIAWNMLTTECKQKAIAQTNASTKPFKCQFEGCTAAFARSSDLKTHRRKHTGEKPYTCSFDGCTAAFARSSDLTTHTRTHTGEKPFKCLVEGCGAAFAKSGSLKMHRRTHTGEKPFKCQFDGCTAAFVQRCHLIEHERTHTGEKPFKCMFEGCGAAFTQSGILRSHTRKHTGEKPFKCTFPECDAAFANSNGLTTHTRTHTGDKPFKCQFEGCGAAFAQSSTLRKHTRTKHPELTD